MYMYLYTCYMYMYPFLLPILALILLTLVSFSAVFDVLPELQSRSQQKEALNLLCLLLPRPNRDTLRELVEFLSRVALHSNDTILLDGTEVGSRTVVILYLHLVFLNPSFFPHSNDMCIHVLYILFRHSDSVFGLILVPMPTISIIILMVDTTSLSLCA